MSAHYPTLRKPLSIETVDRLTVALVGVMAIVQIGAVLSVYQLLDPATVSAGTGTGTSGAGLLTAPVIVGIAIAEALGILTLYRFWKRFPQWLRTVGYYALWAGVCATVALFVGLAFGWLAVVGGACVIAVHRLLSRSDLNWITHNGIAAGLSVAAAAYLGMQVPPGVVLVALVLLIIWDHVAVFETGWMMELGGWAGASRLPLYFVIPRGLQLDFEQLRQYVEAPENAERPAGLGAVLGVGDVLLPALLTASVVATLPGALPGAAIGVALGACAAVVKLRSDMESYEGGVPALPWIASGSILGYTVGVLITGLSLGMALGVGLLA